MVLELPVRILGPPSEDGADDDHACVVSVDGVTERPGLHLSHWPGNATPAALKHDLSTGCALNFARLPVDERARLCAGATAFANNHYDTDGALALLAARHPERSLPRAERMLSAAAAGDFFRWPDDDALALDAIVAGLNAGAASPLAAELAGLEPRARWQHCTDHLMDALPDLLDGERAPWRALWEPALENARADRADLARCARESLPELDLALWTAPRDARSSRDAARARFDPGRHALFGATEHDRALVIGASADGTTYRLIVSTLSWFDLVSPRRMPRPDLERLAAELNEREGRAPYEAYAWRAQARTNASPELWFGGRELDAFAEHNDALAPSSLPSSLVRATLERALARSGP